MISKVCSVSGFVQSMDVASQYNPLVVWLFVGVRGSWRCPSPNLLPHTTRMVPYKDKCYQFVHIETFWTSARNYCRQVRLYTDLHIPQPVTTADRYVYTQTFIYLSL